MAEPEEGGGRKSRGDSRIAPTVFGKWYNLHQAQMVMKYCLFDRVSRFAPIQNSEFRVQN